MTRRRIRFAAIGGMLVLLTASSCSGDDGVLSVDGAWARSSARTQNAGAAYMSIEGGDLGDRLIGVSVSKDVAAMAELHESVMAGDGTMTMQAVPSVEIGPHSRVSFEPGGLHIMLMQLAEPLEDGATFSLVLRFEQAGDMTVEFEIRDE